MDNFRQRFFFPDTDLRGEFLRLDSALTPIMTARDYPLEVQGLLGEALAAAALMSGTLKYEGRLSLHAQGKGELTLLVAEASNDNSVRGLARWQDNLSGDGQQPSLRQLLGCDAGLAITLHPQQGKSYQSLVPLEADDLAGCLAHYFEQSEQLPTRLWLACGNGRAAGLLLQRLPEQNANREHNETQWDTLKLLGDTIKTDELLSLDADTLLHRLFHETPPEREAPSELHFACTCSRDKVEQMLLSLGADTLQSLLEEQGEADISCDFCRQTQVFDAVDLQQLIRQLK